MMLTTIFRLHIAGGTPLVRAWRGAPSIYHTRFSSAILLPFPLPYATHHPPTHSGNPQPTSVSLQYTILLCICIVCIETHAAARPTRLSARNPIRKLRLCVPASVPNGTAHADR
ncbi:uncharacterized protein CC84DRAFT_361578 [Paraphaeosphaeria sporulosa]|uniref:Uncharacterized protein n=1 Tax=Paraphaeosphaeria sporulosa TaxID=1460663 RepID=A0A177BZY7_9PLEO|nr:uncharacterized protein CC84DRAFT_361578 [Paraphaeosphaeria sporulosa]OAG00162.1 hypothetical protein CC84DRAFT_361578 [Paraphaeosphaeria sporulosa]